MVFERRILDDKKDGRQTSSEVKPGRAGLVLGWVTSLQREAAVMINTTPSHRLGLLFAFFCHMRSAVLITSLFLFVFVLFFGTLGLVCREAPSLKMGSVCLFVCLFVFSYNFLGGRLPLLC